MIKSIPLLFQNQVLCPVCGTGRERPLLKVPFAKIFFISLGWAVLAGMGFGLWLGLISGFWGALAFGVLSFIGFESYYTSKFRRELICPICQFDPILYRRAPEEAKARCLQSLKQQEEVFQSRWKMLQSAK